MLVIGVYTAPVISKAGDTFGVAFSVDGQEKYTERQNKTTSSSVNMECTDKDIDGSYYHDSRQLNIPDILHKPYYNALHIPS